MAKLKYIFLVMLLACLPFALASPYASGGAETYDNGYYVHTFLSNGTLTILQDILNASVLVVAGGGGGSGANGGGGGAGGLIYKASMDITNNITAIIGMGGEGNNNGTNSVFGSLLAYGGGRGGWGAAAIDYAGQDGGSGGGSFIDSAPAGNGVSGQGYAGGIGESTTYCYGGGGGSGGAGHNAISGGTAYAGDGGNGTYINISGVNDCYAGGGGGGCYSGGWAHGKCGGGDGGIFGSINPTPATNGTGSGGGGGGTIGGAGANGVIVIRYKNESIKAPPGDLCNTTYHENWNIYFDRILNNTYQFSLNPIGWFSGIGGEGQVSCYNISLYNASNMADLIDYGNLSACDGSAHYIHSYTFNASLLGNFKIGVWGLSVYDCLIPENYTNAFSVCEGNYSCSHFDDCDTSNISACLSVVDYSTCSLVYPGNLSDFNINCSYTPPPPSNTTGNNNGVGISESAILIFIMIFFWLALLTLTLIFRNFAIASLMFFVGVGLGYYLSRVSFALGGVVLIFDILIFAGLGKLRN